MTGFNIDPEALENAIKKLEDAKAEAEGVADSAMELKPGELSAGDSVTASAKDKFRELANQDAGSLRASAREISNQLGSKIDAYRATLEEYRRAEDASTVDASRINQQH